MSDCGENKPPLHSTAPASSPPLGNSQLKLEGGSAACFALQVVEDRLEPIDSDLISQRDEREGYAKPEEKLQETTKNYPPTTPPLIPTRKS